MFRPTLGHLQAIILHEANYNSMHNLYVDRFQYVFQTQRMVRACVRVCQNY